MEWKTELWKTKQNALFLTLEKQWKLELGDAYDTTPQCSGNKGMAGESYRRIWNYEHKKECGGLYLDLEAHKGSGNREAQGTERTTLAWAAGTCNNS